MRGAKLRLSVLAAGGLLLLGAGRAEAQKTDSVWINNGDRITGEVKSLSRGLLIYSTDDLGTISIEWDKVDSLSTTKIFEILLDNGEKYIGPLGRATQGHVLLGSDTVALTRVVSVAPIKQSFFDRLDGYLDLGVSYQKAHSTFQLTSGAKVVYRGPGAETGFEISTFFEDRDDVGSTSRLSSSLTEQLLFKHHWSAGLVLGFDRNQELDLAGRGRLMAFGARGLAQSNHVDFKAAAGFVVTNERYFSVDSTTQGFEGMLGISFNAFRYDHPKLDASISSQAFPSFTTAGRVRLQNDLRLSHELVKDFMLTVTVFDTYDSKPPAADASKNDFGTTLAVSWTF
jgi:hypothetical protein